MVSSAARAPQQTRKPTGTHSTEPIQFHQFYVHSCGCVGERDLVPRNSVRSVDAGEHHHHLHTEPFQHTGVPGYPSTLRAHLTSAPATSSLCPAAILFHLNFVIHLCKGNQIPCSLLRLAFALSIISRRSTQAMCSFSLLNVFRGTQGGASGFTLVSTENNTVTDK